MWTLTGLLRGVSNSPVKISCAYFGHIYILFRVLFILFYVRCLNILNFGHWYHIWDPKKMKHFHCCAIPERYFGHVLPVILYLARARAGQRAHYSKCFNDFYEAYIINHISIKSSKTSLTGSNKTYPLGGNIAPPPRPDVNLKAEAWLSMHETRICK